jgi:hypothetical protein
VKLVPKNLTTKKLQQRREVFADLLQQICKNDEGRNTTINRDEAEKVLEISRLTQFQ